jgi:hypothetical protein
MELRIIQWYRGVINLLAFSCFQKPISAFLYYSVTKKITFLVHVKGIKDVVLGLWLIPVTCGKDWKWAPDAGAPRW